MGADSWDGVRHQTKRIWIFAVFFQFRWVFSFLCLRYFLQDLGLRASQIQKHVQQTYVQNRTRFAKVASYETSQETSVSCTQLVVLYAPFQFGSEYNFLEETIHFSVSGFRLLFVLMNDLPFND